MTEISAAMVKALREKTNQPMMECKQALLEANGDEDKAVDILRKKGLSGIAKRSDRTTKEGLIGSYIHHNAKVGALVELNSETDFVARSEAFKQLVADLAIHVCAAAPLAANVEDLDAETLAKERQMYAEQVTDKPANIVEKIVEGKMRRFYEEHVLLEQAFVKDDKKKVKDLVAELSTKTGEKITVGRFARFAVGG